MWTLCRIVLSLRNIIIVLVTPVLLLPLPLVVDTQAALCAYVILLMAVYWLTEALPINVTALLPVCLFPLVGVLSANAVAKAFFTSTTLMFIGGMTVAVAIQDWNIHTRVALKVLLLLGPKPGRLMLGLMLTTWFLSLWVCNAATTAMMLPIATAILDQLKTNENNARIDTNDTFVVRADDDEDDVHKTCNGHVDSEAAVFVQDNHCSCEIEVRNGKIKSLAGKKPLISGTDDAAEKEWKQLGKALSLCIAYAANIGGTGSMTGAAPNLVLKDQIDAVYSKQGRDSPLTFGLWLAFGIPTSLVMLGLCWLWLQLYFLRCSMFCKRQSCINEEVVRSVLTEQYKRLGKLSFGQVAVLIHLVVIATLWVTNDMGGTVGWSDLFKDKFIKDSVPAVLVGCLLFVFPSKLPGKHIAECGDIITQIPPLLSWQSFRNKMPWGVIFLLGGGFSVANAAQVSGLSTWIGEQLGAFGHLPPLLLSLTLCFIVAGVTEFSSNAATTVLILPILAQLSIAAQLEPLYLMLPATIAASFAFMFPVASPPNAMVFAHGYVTVADMVKAGFTLNILTVFVLVLSMEVLGKAIYSL